MDLGKFENSWAGIADAVLVVGHAGTGVLIDASGLGTPVLMMPRRASRERPSLDWSGLITLSIAIAGAQLVFSRGQRLDWFQSSEIVIVTFVTIIAFYMFFAHSLTAERPFIRLYLLKDRNYALGLILVFIFGMLNFAPVVLLPPLLQNFSGYTDSAIGVFIGWRGFGTALGFDRSCPNCPHCASGSRMYRRRGRCWPLEHSEDTPGRESSR